MDSPILSPSNRLPPTPSRAGSLDNILAAAAGCSSPAFGANQIRQRALLRALSSSSLGSCSPSRANASPRPPLAGPGPLAIPMPPPLALSSPGSFGGDSDCEELSLAAEQALPRSRVSSAPDEFRPTPRGFSGLKRMRSFGSQSRPSLLGPSRGGISPGPATHACDGLLSSAAAAGSHQVRPPPIRTVASLEGGFDCASPPPSLFLGRSSSSGIAPPPATPRNASGGWTGGGLGGGPAGGRQRGFVPLHHARNGAPSMSLVAPSLYVGDETAAASMAELTGAGVTHVLNCTAMRNVLEGQPGAPEYLSLGLMDNAGDLPRMQHCLQLGTDFIAHALGQGGTVLVHCHRGVSRSATLAIAHLVRSLQQPAEAVFEQLRACRRIVDPNLTYWMALKEWERRVLPPALLRAYSASRTPTHAGTASPVVRPLSRAG